MGFLQGVEGLWSALASHNGGHQYGWTQREGPAGLAVSKSWCFGLVWELICMHLLKRKKQHPLPLLSQFLISLNLLVRIIKLNTGK